MDGSERVALVVNDVSDGEKELDVALRLLDGFLRLLGFLDSPSWERLAASCAAFLILGIAVPYGTIRLSQSSRSNDEYEVQQFELSVLVSESSLAAVSLASVSWYLLGYGLRRFLFVDQHHGQAERFQEQYARKIKEFFCLILLWLLPCFLVKTAREIVRFIYIFHESIWRSVVVLLASIVSWVYLTIILLSSCMLFNLVCNLQGIHFEDYKKLFERDLNVFMCLEEHKHLRYHLSTISHRFRIFLILLFVFVTTSQFVTLLQTTGYSGKINFANAGDIAVSSVVQVVVVVICLNAAAKISHRARGIASFASRWHAYVTCCPTGSQMRATKSTGDLGATPETSSLIADSESSLTSQDIAMQNNAQLAAVATSFHKRQALVTYLQSNPGGITIYGWTVDRAMLNTIFFLELTLVLFVLGKTLVFPWE